jgi:hypothetical protein
MTTLASVLPRRLALGLGAVARARDAAYAAATALVAGLLTVPTLRLWDANLSLPFAYRGDALLVLANIKTILEQGWYTGTPLLGAPFGQQLYDYPVLNGNNLHVLVIKLLGLVSQDPALVANLFFLLTFPLAAVTSFFVMRTASVSAPVASVCSLLFAFAPYHFVRGEWHLFLAAYYTVPLSAYLVLSVLGDRPLFRRRPSGLAPLSLLSARSLATCALCAVVASASLYYASFTIALVLASGLVTALARRSLRPAVTAAAVTGLVAIVLLSSFAPTFVYHARHGSNPAVASRTASESELLGLKLTDLLLPSEHHRLAPLASVGDRYRTTTPLPAEGDQSLGTVASIGLVALVFSLLAAAIRGSDRRGPGRFGNVAVAAFAAVLLGTTGGVATLFGYLVAPQLHAWNRISIFIVFFSLLGVGLVLDRVRARARRRGLGARLAFVSLLLATLVLGVLDQTSRSFAPDFAGIAEAYGSDAAFVAEIERRLGEGAIVYQLPYLTFPEAPGAAAGRGRPSADLHDYDHMRGYLHSASLRWAYGGMRGRPADWGYALVGLRPVPMLDALVASGVDGLWIDRSGYDDSGRALESELAGALRQAPLVSPDQGLSFFDLRVYRRRAAARYSPSELAALAAATLGRIHVEWRGFWDTERQGGRLWRWSKAQRSSIVFVNPSSAARLVRLTATFATGTAAYSPVEIKPPTGSPTRVWTSSRGTTVERTFRAEPGRQVLTLTADTVRVRTVPGDPRPALYLRVSDVTLRDVTFGSLDAKPRFEPLLDLWRQGT